MARLEEVCEILDSKRVPITAANRTPGPFPYYGANGVQDYVAEYIFDDELVLVAEDGGYFGSKDRPIAYRVSGKCWVNNHAHVLKPKAMIDVDYLCYSLMYRDVSDIVNGATRQKLTQADLRKIEIDVPTPQHQEKIVAQLDEVFSLISLRKQQLAKLDELVKARFVELFGEVETNLKGFPMKRMDECCKFIGGAQPDKSHFEYERTDDNIRLIQIRDYKSDRFITYIPKSLARKTCTASDIMIGRYGPPIFQILGGIEGAYNVALMKAVPTDEFNTEYFRYFLKNEKLLRYLESFSQRTAGQDGIQIDKLNTYPCFVPPMELQIQFAAFVEQTDKSKLSVQQSIDQLETLKKSLMQKYFG